jgi:hypothetical protein
LSIGLRILTEEEDEDEDEAFFGSLLLYELG